MEILELLRNHGPQTDMLMLLMICGLIEIIKKYFASKIKDTTVYVYIAAGLSIGAAFLATPLTVSGVIVSAVSYFVLTTLAYDAIISPLKSLKKRE